MPPKRTWSQANETGAPSASPASRSRPADSANDDAVPSISRKVKACASCRKQKIKCIMDDSGPPCKRCAERSLSCVLNKSLQTLIEERSQWKDTVVGDLSHIHSSLQQALAQLSLPPLPPLQSSALQDPEQTNQLELNSHEDELPSCDNSPRISPKEEGLPHAPIESLYQITRLRALRSDDPSEERQALMQSRASRPLNDFISKGAVSVEDAERLVGFFLNRIDHFMYMIGGGKHRDLESFRRSSSLLTACVCTVAALHDPSSNHLYGICNREFRRLMSASMFVRRMDQDSMRAMCIATYWLHDLSWMISGYAIRRAMEVNLGSNYQRVLADSNEEAMINLRIWYVLYICDRHLSILYGRPSIVRDDASIAGWERLMTTSVFTESDKRLVSQMALLIIMGNVRDLFGPDTGEPIPKAFAPKLMTFSLQIDHWMGFWSTELLRIHEHIGEFPTKGANLHHHLAKLHLHSHVFRGLRGNSVPPYFQDSARAAVAAAISIIELVLVDSDIRDGLVGIPHYIHSMIAFACVFLLKVSTQYPAQYVDDSVIYNLTTRAVQQFRATPVGKWHLVHMMAEGLEKMIAKQTNTATTPGPVHHNGTSQLGFQHVSLEPGTDSTPLQNGDKSYSDDLFGNGFDEGFNFGTSSILNFDTGTLDLDFTGFGF
ncbi:hypothetical protein N0V83_007741 [Neocucurbitaria cava]|uniref:Zn(2)-C6 fungal-type domain-containing protein n=1 Tax=Neocucurbitaria cava TaxID=798079 RepID=A0A9W9CJT0_9PLEO|nr:hypothetical protein N0V83_007741 [Neocucurbitaria cava]